jgi:7-cyano-7-deazaguanine reductase
VPGPKIVELKSLKLYLWSFRDEGHFHEDVTNRVLDDLLSCLEPRKMSIVSVWNVRGGITTTVRAAYP